MILQIVIFILLLILAVIIPLEHIFGKRKRLINSPNTLSWVVALFLFNIVTTIGNRYDSAIFYILTIGLVAISFLSNFVGKLLRGNEFNIPDFENVSVENVFQKALYNSKFPDFSRETEEESKKVKYSFKPEKYTIEFNTKKYFFERGNYHTITFKNSVPKEKKLSVLEFMEDYLRQQGEPETKWRTRLVESVLVLVMVIGAMVFMNYSVLHPKGIEQIYKEMPETIMVDKYDRQTHEIENVKITDPAVIAAVLTPVDEAYIYHISNTYLDEKDTTFKYRISVPGSAFELYYNDSKITLFYNYETLRKDDSSWWMQFMVYFSHIYSQKNGTYYYLIHQDAYAERDAERLLSQYFN